MTSEPVDIELAFARLQSAVDTTLALALLTKDTCAKLDAAREAGDLQAGAEAAYEDVRARIAIMQEGAAVRCGLSARAEG
jgi:hypothetical protein